ncbi:MAG: hypothetical protein Phog2KO_22110 [Phototrophicaceae bacterium]
MPWTKKEQSTPFDKLPIEGLHFLDGDVMAIAFQKAYLSGEKYPLIEFPSGSVFTIWENSNPSDVTVHLFGEMDLPHNQNREEAFETALKIADVLGYVVKKREDNQLELHGFADEEHFLLTYDNEQAHLDNVEPIAFPKETAKHPAHILMNDEIQALLPPLYANEDIGMNAIAPVKYFHPTSDWTWYASEYNADKGLFFGLVVGYDIELGYFSLEELESISAGKGLNLPIERDLHYTPKSLEDLQKLHRSQDN